MGKADFMEPTVKTHITMNSSKYKGVKIFAMGENVFAMVNDGA